ncbi:two-component regulator propeller domain-containing protein [Flavivirga amylovorans]|uniref:histidine kinase n=1 Tax=Flavivirga amylovorans TaxID=870486 RepID=A0ABT8WZH0_9FLAO|nr:hybrid sensor histidine kinase/response regulator transcription factor [Flavivirga amylovorans]MDO5987081.1 two-component regulator propeller domain-containing protein [Flavivirga amylovorans]
MRVLLKTFYLIIVLNIYCNHTFSQTDYKFKHLNTTDGLSQSTVIAIKQDTLGQIWLGTRDGLNKYDGTHFEVFKHNPQDSTSISNNDILCIQEDKNHYLWVGTSNGLNRYNPFLKTFKRFLYSNSNSGQRVLSMKSMLNGDLWFGTSNGISIYDIASDTLKTNIDYLNEDFSGTVVQVIEQSANGVIWLGTQNGLYKLEGTENGKYNFKIFADGERRLNITDIYVNNNSSLFVGTKNNGLFSLDVATELLSPISLPDNGLRIAQDIRSIIKDKQDNLWVGTNSGIYIFSKGKKLINIITDSNNLEGISNNYIKKLFVDRKGSVWVGSYFGGINIWDRTNTNFVNYSKKITGLGLSHNVIGVLAKKDDTTILIGTEGGGVNVLDHKKNSIEHLVPENYQRLLNENVKSLLYHNDQLWIGTFSNGILIYDFKTNRILKNKLPEALSQILKNSGIYSLETCGNDVLLIGTFGDGLIQYHLKSKFYRFFRHNSENKNSIINNHIRRILVESESKIWLCNTRGISLIEFNDDLKNSFKVSRYLYNETTQVGENIRTLFKDSNGIIWAGSKDGNIYKFSENKFEKIPLNIPLAAIQGILEDNPDNLWLSTSKGLINFNKKSQKAIRYDESDGMIGSEYNDNAALKTVNGTFYFGSTLGLTSFVPSKLTKNTYAPKVLLTNLMIQNKYIKPLDSSEVLSQNITYNKTLVLKHTNTNFSIHFSIPNFINPKKNRYKYRLLGLETAWKETNQTSAYYTIQNPGTYNFEVMGANNDGFWNPNPTKLSVIVKPAPWRSNWAIFIYLLTLSGIVYSVFSFFRSRSKLKTQLQIEHLERERDKEINQEKLEFFTNVSHEFRTPLTLITGPLQQLLKDYKGSNEVYKKLLLIEGNAKQLLQLINRLMDFRKLENKQSSLKAAKGNIVKFVNEIYLSFTELARIGNYTYNFEASPKEILVYYDREKLEQVFFNLLSNAFKYTPKQGNITVQIEKTKSTITMRVIDSGCGINEVHAKKLFDRFYQTPKQSEYHKQIKGTGIGLSIVKNIVELHRGTVDVVSNAFGGSTFTVTLPLGKSHLHPKEIIKNFKFSDDISLYENPFQNKSLKKIVDFKNAVPIEEQATILVVEDNHSLRAFIKDVLKNSYNIIDASNGKEALSKVLKKAPDLIISDVIMPEMSGTELCEKIKNNVKTSHIPIILLTSRSALIYKVDGLERGADDYISKPFDVEEFYLRVRNMIISNNRMKARYKNDDILIPEEVTVSSIDDTLFKKAIVLVTDNISNEQFDIPTFSSELGISRTLLFTKIKAWTNFTPNGFINEIRLQRAKEILENNAEINISQVSYMVGFKYSKYFSKCFQKRFGETPKKYVKKFNSDFID